MRNTIKRYVILTIFLISFGSSLFSQYKENITINESERKEIEAMIKGRFGYNPYISIQENRRFYADNGYTISYRIKDKTIYLLVFGGIAVIISGIYLYNINQNKMRRQKR